ncbi:MAG: MarR family transcriptional regulator [Alphaproteobacteria bacterium]|nr:MarR family transcriptional regulator [Alphaproteobacteria bacterium]
MATGKDRTRKAEHEGTRRIPETGLGLLLREAFMSYQRNFQAALGEYGLTYSQWRHLWLLLRDGQLTPVELSERAGVKKASSTAIIQSMVERGLIRRARDREDRRKVNLSLTAAAIELIETLSLSGRIINRHARAGIDDDDFAAMLETLHKVIANLDQLGNVDSRETLLNTICPKIPKR